MGIGIFLGLVFIVYQVGRVPRQRVQSMIGTAAPPMEFILDGKQKNLADYQGQVVLLNFWASWCEPCMEEMPSLRQLENKFNEQGFLILAINVSAEPLNVLDKFPPEQVPQARVHQFRETQVDAYKIEAIPHSVLIDKSGIVREIYLGPREWNSQQIIDTVEKYL